MKLEKFAAEVGREAVVVLCGAIVAAAVLQAFPNLKRWIAERLPSRP